MSDTKNDGATESQPSQDPDQIPSGAGTDTGGGDPEQDTTSGGDPDPS